MGHRHITTTFWKLSPFTMCHAVGGREIGSISRVPSSSHQAGVEFKNMNHSKRRRWPWMIHVLLCLKMSIREKDDDPSQAPSPFHLQGQANKNDIIYNNTRKVKMALIWLHPSFFASGTYGDFSTITASNFFFQEFINTKYWLIRIQKWWPRGKTNHKVEI